MVHVGVHEALISEGINAVADKNRHRNCEIYRKFAIVPAIFIILSPMSDKSLSASCAPHYLLLSFYCRSYYFSPTISFLTFRNQTADNTPASGNRSMLPHIPSPS